MTREKKVKCVRFAKLHLLANRQKNVMRFVTLHICSLLNISLKHMKKLPLFFYSDYYQGTLKNVVFPKEIVSDDPTST